MKLREEFEDVCDTASEEDEPPVVRVMWRLVSVSVTDSSLLACCVPLTVSIFLTP